MEWDYTLDSGIELRKLIDESDPAPVVRKIFDICKFLVESVLTDEDASDAFRELHDVTMGEDEAIKDGTFNEWFDGSAEELADTRLHEFYDLCDEYRIWIEL